MKKLNLNEPGGKLVLGSTALLLPVPVALWLLSRLLGAWTEALHRAMLVSLSAGAVLLAATLALVAIELRQDARLIERHESERGIKVRLSGGLYECQHCGSRMLGRDDKHCRVCGRPLEQTGRVDR